MKKRGPPSYRPPTRTVHLQLDEQLLKTFDQVFPLNRTAAIERAMRCLIETAKIPEEKEETCESSH